MTGKVYSILLIAVLAVGTYYIAKTNDMIAAITSGGSKVDKMVVAVLKMIRQKHWRMHPITSSEFNLIPELRT